MAGNKCDDLGHCWEPGAAAGWFLCRRQLGSKSARGGASLQPVYCNVVAYCPGCVGYCLTTHPIVFCSLHEGLDLQTIPLAVHRKQSVSPAPPPKQQSFW